MLSINEIYKENNGAQNEAQISLEKIKKNN